jgi:hypothetical protein
MSDNEHDAGGTRGRKERRKRPPLPFDLGMRSLQRALSWLDARRSYKPGITTLRRVLPGDSRFGDPLSTAGTDPG